MPELSNYTFDEISLGQRASYTRAVREQDILLFAAVSGDVNPLHLDAEFAATTRFGERIAHGMLTAAFISAALAMELPGPGTIFMEQSLRFRLPVKIGDEITVELEVTEKNERRKTVTLDCKALNQNGKVVVTGSALVLAPGEKEVMPRPAEPRARIES